MDENYLQGLEDGMGKDALALILPMATSYYRGHGDPHETKIGAGLGAGIGALLGRHNVVVKKRFLRSPVLKKKISVLHILLGAAVGAGGARIGSLAAKGTGRASKKVV